MYNLITPEKFHCMVESLRQSDGLTYVESILQVCEERMIDPLDIKPLIDENLKEILRAEVKTQKLKATLFG